MALQSSNVNYIIDRDDNIIFPVTHSDALVGPISKRLYNISDIYNNDWNNVITNGCYKDMATYSIISAGSGASYSDYDVYNFYYNTTIGTVTSYESDAVYYQDNPEIISAANISVDTDYYDSIGLPYPSIDGLDINEYLPISEYNVDGSICSFVVNGIHVLTSEYTLGAPTLSQEDVDSSLPLEYAEYEVVNNVCKCVINNVHLILSSYSFLPIPTKPNITITYPFTDFTTVISSGETIYLFENNGIHLRFVNPVVKYDTTNITNRPPETDNNYGESCFIDVTNSGNHIIQKTSYPSTNSSNPIAMSDGTLISKNYYRIGTVMVLETGTEISWDPWKEIVSSSGGGSSDPGYIDITNVNIPVSSWGTTSGSCSLSLNRDISKCMIFVEPTSSSKNTYSEYGIKFEIVNAITGILRFTTALVNNSYIIPKSNINLDIKIYSVGEYNNADITSY